MASLIFQNFFFSMYFNCITCSFRNQFYTSIWTLREALLCFKRIINIFVKFFLQSFYLYIRQKEKDSLKKHKTKILQLFHPFVIDHCLVFFQMHHIHHRIFDKGYFPKSKKEKQLRRIVNNSNLLLVMI